MAVSTEPTPDLDALSLLATDLNIAVAASARARIGPLIDHHDDARPDPWTGPELQPQGA